MPKLGMRTIRRRHAVAGLRSAPTPRARLHAHRSETGDAQIPRALTHAYVEAQLLRPAIMASGRSE
jgi:hypothetical protein